MPSLPSLLSMLLLVDLAEEEVLPEEFDLELELDLFLPLGDEVLFTVESGLLRDTGRDGIDEEEEAGFEYPAPLFRGEASVLVLVLLFPV